MIPDPSIQRKMLLSSDYPMDKVAYIKEGSLLIKNGDIQLPVAHGLPFAPLLLGSWSFTPDFETAYEFGSFAFANRELSQVSTTTNSTNILFGSLFPDESARMIYYSIFGYAPSDYTGKILIPPQRKGLKFDSRKNYLKLFDADVVNLSSTPILVPHNLGYEPTVIVWLEGNGGIEKHTVDGSDPASNVSNVSTTSLSLRDSSGIGSYTKAHYRIYLDD